MAFCLVVPSQLLADEHETVQWINHLDFLAGDSEITTVYNSALGGLEVTAESTGEHSIVQGLQASPGFLVTGVRVCYELNSAGSFIDEIGIAQLQDPPDTSTVLLADTTDQTDMGPVCVNSAPPFDDSIDPGTGALSLGLGVDFADTADNIVILGVGLLTIPDPNSPVSQLEEDVAQLEEDVAQLNSDIERIAAVLIEHGMRLDTLEQDLDRLTDLVIKHTHTYLTGKGVGHNKVLATSSTFTLETETPTPKPGTKAKEQPNKNKTRWSGKRSGKK
jgi:uncharacterized coiled-coil protein SlyX